MNEQNAIKQKKNKLYSDLLIAIKEETIGTNKTTKNTSSNEMSLYDAIKSSFQNLEKHK